jgi:hypothetical protein
MQAIEEALFANRKTKEKNNVVLFSGGEIYMKSGKRHFS